MEKVLFVVTSHSQMGDSGKKTGYWLSEVIHPYSVLEGKVDIDIVSPQGGQPPVDPNSIDLNDPINAKYWNDPEWKKKMANTMKPSEVDASLYDAIFYAGGHGAMWDFPNNTALANIASTIYEKGGYVSAVCHGPAGLLNIRLSDGNLLIDGKRLDGFTNIEEHLNGTWDIVPFHLQTSLLEGGCIFDEVKAWGDHVLTDGRLITGQNPQSALSLGKTLLKMLTNE